MTLKILREYESGGLKTVEYTRDGITTTHTIKRTIPQEPQPSGLQISLKEQILAETQYQTALLEMQMLGGM